MMWVLKFAAVGLLIGMTIGVSYRLGQNNMIDLAKRAAILADRAIVAAENIQAERDKCLNGAEL